jgi:hypothetical protein
LSVIRPIDKQTTTTGAAGTQTVDVVTTGFNTMTVIARIGNAATPATALGDVAVTVQAYDDLGVLVPINLPVAITSPANVLAANVANALAVYSLFGIEKVKITLTNNNAGALQNANVVVALKSPAVS